MKLTMVSPFDDVCHACEDAFEGEEQVEVVHGLFQDVEEWDCLVSPANSFGLMEGGFDAAISKTFPSLQERVQEMIVRNWRGEQPVGTCEFVRINEQRPWLAVVPVARVPQAIAGTDAVYVAMWALLNGVRRHRERVLAMGDELDDEQRRRPEHTRISSVLCPVFGTGTGGVSAASAAAQMALAWRNFKSPPETISRRMASERQKAVMQAVRLGAEARTSL